MRSHSIDQRLCRNSAGVTEAPGECTHPDWTDPGSFGGGLVAADEFQ